MYGKLKTALSYLYYITYFFVIGTWLIISVFVIAAKASGRELVSVTSGSMSPVINKNALILVDRDITGLKVEDIITFKTESGGYTTHRLIYIVDNKRLVTKGDNNGLAEEIAVADVLGKVVYSVNNLGWLADFTKKPYGFIIIAGSILLLAAADILIKRVKPADKGKKI